MSEVEVGSVQQQSNERCASAGLMLREARESRQVSIQMLASSLKVPVVKLQALEDGHWDEYTDLVFTRALAQSVCRILQIESAPIMELLPKAGAARLSTNPEGINTPFKDKTLRSSMSSSSEGSGGNIAKLLAVLLITAAGAAALYFLPQWQAEGDSESTVGAVPGSADFPVALPEPLVMAAPAPAIDAASVTTVAPGTLPSSTAVAPTSDAVLATTAGATPAATTPPTAAPVLAKPAEQAAVVSGNAQPVLRFTATGESWVQVRNAQQQVVMEKILKAGDVYEGTAAGRPLQVVIGNADFTRLEIDGAAWDLAARAKNNVARFEVK